MSSANNSLTALVHSWLACAQTKFPAPCVSDASQATFLSPKRGLWEFVVTGLDKPTPNPHTWERSARMGWRGTASVETSFLGLECNTFCFTAPKSEGTTWKQRQPPWFQLCLSVSGHDGPGNAPMLGKAVSGRTKSVESCSAATEASRAAGHVRQHNTVQQNIFIRGVHEITY